MGVTETAVEVTRYYVTPSWVATYYGVPKVAVYRAIWANRLKATRVRGGGFVLDSRTLPAKFPR